MTRHLALMLFACLAVSAAGCGPAELDPQAQKMLLSAYDSVQADRNAQAVETLDAFLAENGSSARADEGLYLRGLAHYRLGHADKARQNLQAAADRTDNAELRGKAHLALGEIAWKDENWQGVEQNYRSAIEAMPEGKGPVDIAYFRLGCVLQRMGKWQEADMQFHRVMDLKPDSEAANRARRRVNASAWSIQTGAFTSRDNAKKRSAELTRKGLATTVMPVQSEGELKFLVLVGRYETMSQAQKKLPEVRRHQPDAVIVTR